MSEMQAAIEAVQRCDEDDLISVLSTIGDRLKDLGYWTPAAIAQQSAEQLRIRVNTEV